MTCAATSTASISAASPWTSTSSSPSSAPDSRYRSSLEIPHLSAEVVGDPARLERLVPAWTELLRRSDNDQPTVSPLWLLEWWRVFGGLDGRQLRAVVFWDGSRLVGLAPLVWRRVIVPPGLPLRRLELMASGEREADETCSDYIGIVAERGYEQRVAQMLARLLRANALDRWDELILPSMSSEAVMTSLLNVSLANIGSIRHQVSSGCPYIPLPASFDEYLARLGSSTRYQVRRSIRDFEKWCEGDYQIHIARNRMELRKGYSILQDLHRQRWAEAGKRGVFASPRFRAFHEAVLPGLLAADALELSWIEAKGRPVAALYNIVWNGKIHFYQSGRSTEVPEKVRIGIVAHAFAIQRAIDRGLREYDFLAGTSRYKLQLALAVRPLGRIHVIRSRKLSRLRKMMEAGQGMARELRDRYAELRKGRKR